MDGIVTAGKHKFGLKGQLLGSMAYSSGKEKNTKVNPGAIRATILTTGTGGRKQHLLGAGWDSKLKKIIL